MQIIRHPREVIPKILSALFPRFSIDWSKIPTNTIMDFDFLVKKLEVFDLNINLDDVQIMDHGYTSRVTSILREIELTKYQL